MSNDSDPAIRRLAPPGLAPGNGYSHVITAELPARLVVVSGQVALDAEGRLVGSGDLAAQTRQVFANLAAALAAVPAGWEHVIKLGFYVRDARHVGVVRAVRDEVLPAGVAPASTLVEVSGLFRDDLLVEIDAMAVVSG